MQSRPARLARGLVAGGFAVLTAAVSHTLAGADAPSPLALLLALVFAGLLGTAVTGTRPSLPRLAALVAASQVAFHLGFVLLGTSAPSATGHHSVGGHGAASPAAVPLDLDGIASSPAHAHLDTAGMWIAHAIAAVVTIGMLRLAESAAWTLLVHLATRLVVAVLRATRALPVPRPASAVALSTDELPPAGPRTRRRLAATPRAPVSLLRLSARAPCSRRAPSSGAPASRGTNEAARRPATAHLERSDMTARRTPLIAASALGAGALLALGAPLAASAHVTVDPSTTAAGSYSVLTFSMGHGCEGSPTTSVAFTIPESVASVTPTVNPGWTIEKVMEELDTPTESSHGDAVTERVAQVVYTADQPFEDGLRTTFALQMPLPDAAGETILFPALQTCEVGSTDWADSDPEAAAPAPSITVTDAESGDGHGHGGDDAGSDADSASNAAPTAAASFEPDVLARVLGIAGLVVGVVGVVIAVVSRRRSA